MIGAPATRDDTTPGKGGERRRLRASSRTVAAVAVAVVVFAGVGAYVWARGSGGSTNAPSHVTVPGVKAEIVTTMQLRAIEGAAGRPIYWAGPRAGTRLEYTQRTDGATYVRYLTGSARAGAPGANYVVIATYPQPNAYAQVKRSAAQQHLFVAQLPGDAIAVTRPGRPQNIYVVYRNRPFQIEVYTPSAAETRQIVFGGAVQPVR